MKYLIEGNPGALRRELVNQTIVENISPSEVVIEADVEPSFGSDITVRVFSDQPINIDEWSEVMETLLIQKGLVTRGEINSAVASRVNQRANRP